MPTTLASNALVAVSYPMATVLTTQLNGGTISADLLCRGGWPYPTAVALAALMHAGVGGTPVVGQLLQCGFAGSDAVLVAAQIASQGAR